MDRVPVVITAALVAALAATLASAQPADTERVDSAAVLGNKLRLLADMVQGSPAARRIDAARHSSEAQALLAEARRSHALAEQHLRRGELDTAERLIDTGLRAFGTAARAVADSARQQQAARERYRVLRERITSFRQAFARVVTEKGAAAAVLLDQTRFDGQLSQAESLARARRYREANGHLGQALATVERALTQARDRETLIQTLNFATPRDEYAYELERNRSHRLLVELMLAERQLPAASHTLIEGFLAGNEEARAQAKTLAERGDIVAAIAALEQGTLELVRALRLTGLAF